MCWGVFVVCGAYPVLYGAYAFVFGVYGEFGGRAGSRQMVKEMTLTLPSRAWHPPPTAWGCHRGLSRIFSMNFADEPGRLPADPFSLTSRCEFVVTVVFFVPNMLADDFFDGHLGSFSRNSGVSEFTTLRRPAFRDFRVSMAEFLSGACRGGRPGMPDLEFATRSTISWWRWAPFSPC